MSKRAEEAALKAYPFIPLPQYDLRDENPTDGNKIHRRIFLEGYEQAEKDTIERAAEWLSSIENGDKIVDVKAFVEAFKNEMEEE